MKYSSTLLLKSLSESIIAGFNTDNYAVFHGDEQQKLLGAEIVGPFLDVDMKLTAADDGSAIVLALNNTLHVVTICRGRFAALCHYFDFPITDRNKIAAFQCRFF